jgi:hypothetical protein
LLQSTVQLAAWLLRWPQPPASARATTPPPPLGPSIARPQTAAAKPDTSRLRPLSPHQLAWFGARGISFPTLAANGVAAEQRYMPQMQGEAECIAYVYRQHGEVSVPRPGAAARRGHLGPLCAVVAWGRYVPWSPGAAVCHRGGVSRASCQASLHLPCCSPLAAAWCLQVVNIKYRALPKHFSQTKGGAQVRQQRQGGGGQWAAGGGGGGVLSAADVQ